MPQILGSKSESEMITKNNKKSVDTGPEAKLRSETNSSCMLNLSLYLKI